MIPEEKRVAYNFRRLRKQKNWTQKKTAEKGDVSRTYITRIEIANVGLGSSRLKKWAGIFGVDISEFFKSISGEGKGDGADKCKPGPEKGIPELDLMKAVIEALEEIFQKKRLHLPPMPPKEKTDLIMHMYRKISGGRS